MAPVRLAREPVRNDLCHEWRPRHRASSGTSMRLRPSCRQSGGHTMPLTRIQQFSNCEEAVASAGREAAIAARREAYRPLAAPPGESVAIRHTVPSRAAQRQHLVGRRQKSRTYGFAAEAWACLAGDSRALSQALRRVVRPEEMMFGVEGLERRQHEARERLEMRLADREQAVRKTLNPNPLEVENGPHHYTYKPDPNQDTVMASEDSSRPARPSRQLGRGSPPRRAGCESWPRTTWCAWHPGSGPICGDQAQPGRRSSRPRTGCAMTSTSPSRSGDRPA